MIVTSFLVSLVHLHSTGPLNHSILKRNHSTGGTKELESLGRRVTGLLPDALLQTGIKLNAF